MNDLQTPHPHTQPPHQAGSPRALGSIVIAGVLALIGMSLVSQGPQTNFEDAALAKGTISIFAQRDGKPIHISKLEETPELIEGVAERASDQLILWLGNSQLHAINQAKEGDEPASALLHDVRAPDGADVVAVSYPNANLQEHYASLGYFVPKLSKLKAVILPVVFDDLREAGIRESLLPMLQDEALTESLASTEIGQQLLELRVEESEETESDSDLAGLRDTFQEQTETFLNESLEEHWSLWEARKQARGKIFLKLYEFRNYVFNITPQSKRRLIAPRYKANMAALAASLDLAAESDVAVLVYIVPLRTDVETPYVESEYVRFKEEVEALCEERDGVVFENFEHVVPTEYWGVKQSTSISGGQELDFMHFQEPGHQLLAQAMDEALEQLISGSADE